MKLYKMIFIAACLLYSTACSNKSQVITYFDNGNIKEKYHLNSDGERDGENILYYSDGSIKEKRKYNDGVLNGTRLIYKSGEVEYEVLYNMGKATYITQSHFAYQGEKGNSLIKMTEFETIMRVSEYVNGNISNYAQFIIYGIDTCKRGFQVTIDSTNKVITEYFCPGDCRIPCFRQIEEDGQIITQMLADDDSVFLEKLQIMILNDSLIWRNEINIDYDFSIYFQNKRGINPQ